MAFNDIIGTVGVGLILLAYFFNLKAIIPKDGILYFSLNIIGAGLACYASVLINYIPFIILEATWVLVSLWGFMRVLKTNEN
jgi:hypothetical protein